MVGKFKATASFKPLVTTKSTKEQVDGHMTPIPHVWHVSSLFERSRLWAMILLLFALLVCVVLRLTYLTISTNNVVCMDNTPIGIPADSTTVSHKRSGSQIRIKGTKRRLPQCIIIGARKCGTRALLEFLNLHPQIQITFTLKTHPKMTFGDIPNS